MSSKPAHPEAKPARGRARWPLIVLGGWIALACALFLFTAPPPEAPAVDPQDQAIRARMSAWAERDAEVWDASTGDLDLPWDRAQGHLAIVIDDVGRELDAFDKLHALRFPLNFSVLPGSAYATGVQDRLAADTRRPREILLHLPMEPLDPSHMYTDAERGEDFLRASDDPEALRAKLDAALAAVPGAVGINNHMGSRLTTQAEAMDALMPVLRERGLYFLDSRTTPATLAAFSAERAGVPTISRKVFLDHEPGKKAIRAALEQAALEARRQPCVAIAHSSMDLVEVLEEMLPKLRAEGVGIYPLSRVIAAPRPSLDL